MNFLMFKSVAAETHESTRCDNVVMAIVFKTIMEKVKTAVGHQWPSRRHHTLFCNDKLLIKSPAGYYRTFWDWLFTSNCSIVIWTYVNGDFAPEDTGVRLTFVIAKYGTTVRTYFRLCEESLKIVTPVGLRSPRTTSKFEISYSDRNLPAIIGKVVDDFVRDVR